LDGGVATVAHGAEVDVGEVESTLSEHAVTTSSASIAAAVLTAAGHAPAVRFAP
jgi:hypothetical protein